MSRARAVSLSMVAAGVLVGALVGCGTERPAATPTDPAVSTTAGPSAGEPLTRAPGASDDAPIALSYAGGEVVGGVQRIPITLGSTATLEVSGDQADELHLHGYDLTAAIPAGGTGTITFTADVPGVFELELHGSGALLAQVEVS